MPLDSARALAMAQPGQFSRRIALDRLERNKCLFVAAMARIHLTAASAGPETIAIR